MEEQQKRSHSWRCRLKYLKLFWKSDQIAASQSEPLNISSFRRSFTSNSLEMDRERNGNSLRKSWKKWQNRMNECFSMKKTVIVGGVRENIYDVEPTFRHYQFSQPITTTIVERLTALPPEKKPSTEMVSLAHEFWYWGPASKSLVDKKLDGSPDGSFLIRDSASDRHIYTISFRSMGRTLHARIEHCADGYKVFDHSRYASVKELVEDAVQISEEKGLFCYTKDAFGEPSFPVQLLIPISRYEEVRALQSLARFVIRQHINLNDIDKLCLPATLIGYLKEDNYF